MRKVENQGKPAVTVTSSSTRTAEIRSRWEWTEPSVWTERMLTTLENGVKGGKWYSLIDKVYSSTNLESAWRRVAANRGAAGVDQVSISRYARHLAHNTHKLADSLRTGTYAPLPNRRKWIDKPGRKEKRPLGIPTVRDRHAQTALRQVIEPIFERDFSEHSYGFRPGRGCKDALRAVWSALQKGYLHVLDVDLKSYFDTIPHGRLLKRIRNKISDGRVLNLIESYLKQDVMDGLRRWTPETGAPQGAVISPLLSNIYLDPLDHLIASRRWRIVRYADDLVILCRSAAEAAEAMEVLRRWVHDNGLQLHPDKTRTVDMNLRENGFDFLGYHFERGVRSGRLMRWPSRKSLDKFKSSIRRKTHRCNRYGLPEIISQLNASLPGWFAYFQHSNRYTFSGLDGWIRMRLRSILRKRQKRRGHGYGPDHLRWPNAYFRQLGLYSLMDAWVAKRQSLRSTR